MKEVGGVLEVFGGIVFLDGKSLIKQRRRPTVKDDVIAAFSFDPSHYAMFSTVLCVLFDLARIQKFVILTLEAEVRSNV